MPSYDYHCETCGQDFEIFMPISKRHEPINDSCERNDCSLKLSVSSPKIGYDSYTLGGKKPDEGFRDKLREWKRNVPGNNISDKYIWF